jgi:hypothetical protein
MHVQHDMDASLPGRLCKDLRAFRSIMDVQNVSSVQLVEQGQKDTGVNGLLYYPWRPIQHWVNLVAPMPLRQAKDSVSRKAPGVVEIRTDDCFAPVS